MILIITTITILLMRSLPQFTFFSLFSSKWHLDCQLFISLSQSVHKRFDSVYVLFHISVWKIEVKFMLADWTEEEAWNSESFLMKTITFGHLLSPGASGRIWTPDLSIISCKSSRDYVSKIRASKKGKGPIDKKKFLKIFNFFFFILS
jgi:hypothetical protein